MMAVDVTQDFCVEHIVYNIYTFLGIMIPVRVFITKGQIIPMNYDGYL